jgi:hypothetical protein
MCLVTRAHCLPHCRRPQDFLTAAFYLSGKDRFFTRAQIAQLGAFAGDATDPVALPTPAVLKPVVRAGGLAGAGADERPGVCVWGLREGGGWGREAVWASCTPGEQACPSPG